MDQKLVARLEIAIAKLEAMAGGEEADPDVPPVGYLAFKEICDSQGLPFIESWKKLKGGSYPEDQGGAMKMLKEAMDLLCNYLSMQNKCKKPSPEQMNAYFKPLQDMVKTCEGLKRTRNKALRPFDNYHVVLYEMMVGFSFVFYYPPNLPKTFYEGQKDGVETGANKIWKNRTDDDEDFIKYSKTFVNGVLEIVKANYKMGIEFKGDQEFDGSAKAPESKPAAAKKEEEVKPAPSKAKESKKEGGAGLTAALQQGLAVTGSLKKVEKHQRNKYSGEKISGKVSGGPKKAKIKKKKESKMTKRAQKWYFEDYQNQDLVTIDDSKKHSKEHGFYFVAGVNTNFRIGLEKLKSVELDSCRRTQVEINASIISTVEMVNCKNTTVWIMNKVGAIAIDKCDSPKLVFNKTSWPDDPKERPNIVYSNCTAANIILPDGDDDTKEIALPEQFIFTGANEHGKAVVTTLEHSD